MSAPEAPRSPGIGEFGVNMAALELAEFENAQRLIGQRLSDSGIVVAILGLAEVQLPAGHDLRMGVYRFAYPPAISPTIDGGVFFFQAAAPADITRVTMYRRWAGTETKALGFESEHVAELHDIYGWLDLERSVGNLPNLTADYMRIADNGSPAA